MSRQALDVVGLAGVAMLVVLLVYAFVMDDGEGGSRSVPVRSVTSSSVPRTEPPTTRMARPSPAAAPTTSPTTTAPSQQPSTTRSPAPGRSTPAIVDLPIFPAIRPCSCASGHCPSSDRAAAGHRAADHRAADDRAADHRAADHRAAADRAADGRASDRIADDRASAGPARRTRSLVSRTSTNAVSSISSPDGRSVARRRLVVRVYP